MYSLYILLFIKYVLAQENEERINLCEVCTCSEIGVAPDLNDVLYLNIQCTELDKIVNMPDLNKIEWPANSNGLKVEATFEGLGLSTLEKLPPNPLVDSLRFSNNKIKTYWPDAFKEVPNLKSLAIDNNELTEITPDLFTNIEKLEDLNLSQNKITKFKNSPLNSLVNLKRLFLQENLLDKIPNEDIPASLEDLDLGKNNIYDLLLAENDTMKNVKRLNLNGNHIRTVTKDAFPSMNSFEQLDLSNNKIEMVDDDAFFACTSLIELNIASNNILFAFTLPSSVQILILKHNSIVRWPDLPSGITYLDISYNQLEDMFEETAKFGTLEILNVAGNRFKSFELTKPIPNLRSLDLSYNLLEEIPPSLNDENLPSLYELHLDGNPIHNIYFSSIITLGKLYLNELVSPSVDDKAFSNVVGRNSDDLAKGKQCFSLFMARNEITSIAEGAFEGTNLCYLDISHNNLTTLSPTLLPWTVLAVSGMNLQFNIWDCGCHMQWILEDVLPTMYKTNPYLLEEFRCETPRAVQGLRLVHWYNWTERAMCNDNYMRTGPHGSYVIEEKSLSTLFTEMTTETIILIVCITLCLLIAIGLIVYLIKGRQRHRANMEAMKRKRQNAREESNGHNLEQFEALNKTTQ